ncbi:hypothetical protein BKI49_03155 [Streptomyces sp. Tue6028]|uniref:DUF6214 family protein n=1 Tax=Streptomyces sp. Tue6028 TaxID=2036037 RepID=UPI000BB38BFA|nr:DUF6214 family protein [Streptomyces sp. Tue6028]PBC65493.1 hypothetical protein BKI49_03155 [Streptomyces sp. Tue6028]
MSVWPVWQVRDHRTATSWFDVRLVFADGAQVEVLAVLSGAGVTIEDVRAQPPLSLDDLAVLSDWIEAPLFEACGAAARPAGRREGARGDEGEGAHCDEGEGGRTEPARRARRAWPRGTEGRRLAAEKYRAAQEDGQDPVLAVMCATGHSRRKSLRLIAGAREAGFLTPRHARR